jgi:hypothetical protein
MLPSPFASTYAIIRLIKFSFPLTSKSSHCYPHFFHVYII